MGERRLTSSHERLKDLREGFDGIREIKIFGLENYFISKFSIQLIKTVSLLLLVVSLLCRPKIGHNGWPPSERPNFLNKSLHRS